MLVMLNTKRVLSITKTNGFFLKKKQLLKIASKLLEKDKIDKIATF